MKSLILKINKLNNALKLFYNNKMYPLYKEDNNVYTPDKMKESSNQAQKLDDTLTD